MKFFLLFLFFITSFFANEKYAYFIEPKDYQIVNPNAYTKHVKIGFIKKSLSSFSNSINLATQETSLNIDEYSKEVERTINQDENSKWSKIGFFKTKNYSVYLAKIEKLTKFGNVQMLQMYYIENNFAYVITAASLKENFLKNLKIFKEVIESFEISDDIFSFLHSSQSEDIKKEYFDCIKINKDKNKKFIYKNLKEFEKIISKKKFRLSNHFKFMLLKDLSNKLLKTL
ncbi:MAG: hypothetical protein K1060chlam5_00042 [Candidatus Anoxychlamydiales bacterium]|nr:hypothetical protein [Candidatus Anoxychlamydiales bacterium]